MYLSFYSNVLEPNQITDYLTRVVQPKLTAINGVQKAEILGARTFAMRIWLKPDRMASLNISPTEVRNALAANNYLSALGATKGSMISVNLVANTDLRNAEEFRKLVIRRAGRHDHPPGGHRQREPRRGGLQHRRAFRRQHRPRSWASRCCRPPTRST